MSDYNPTFEGKMLTVRHQLTDSNYYEWKSELLDSLGNFLGAGDEIARNTPFAMEEPMRTTHFKEKVRDENGKITVLNSVWNNAIHGPMLRQLQAEFRSQKRELENQRKKLWPFLVSTLSFEVVVQLKSSFGDNYNKLQAKADTLGLFHLIRDTVLHKGQVSTGEQAISNLRASWHNWKQIDPITKVFTPLPTFLAKFNSFTMLLKDSGAPPTDEAMVSQLLQSIDRKRYHNVIAPHVTSEVLNSEGNAVSKRNFASWCKVLTSLEQSGILSDPGNNSQDPSVALATSEISPTLRGQHKSVKSFKNNHHAKRTFGSHKDNHRYDGAKRKGKASSNHSGPRTQTTSQVCYNCGKFGHLTKACRLPKSECSHCERKGHLPAFCLQNIAKGLQQPQKKTLREAPSQVARVAATPNFEHGWGSDDEEMALMMTTSLKIYNSISDRVVIDSGATSHIFRDRQLVADCRDVVFRSDSLPILAGVSGQDMNTLQVIEAGFIKGFGNFLIVPGSKFNLLSVSQLSRFGNFSIEFSGTLCTISAKDAHSSVRIARSPDNTYSVSIGEMRGLIREKELEFARLLEEESLDDRGDPKLNLSAEQIRRAREVRKLHSILCHPSNDQLISALSSGTILGTRFTAKDVRNGELYFGPCVDCIAGKTQRPSYKISLTSPAEKAGDIVHCDLISFKEETVGGNLVFLVAVDEWSGYLKLLAIKSKQLSELLSSGFDRLISFYCSHQISIKNIQCDSESVLLACSTHLGTAHGIKLKACPPYQHAQRIERYIRTIKDRARAVLNSLPYELPPSLIGELLYSVITSLNDLPNSIHPTQSPRMLVHGDRLDLAQRKLVSFGALAMFHTPGNEKAGLEAIQTPRSELGIVLGPSDTSYNSVRAYLFHKTGVRVRNHFTILNRLPVDFAWRLKTDSNGPTIRMIARMFKKFEVLDPNYLLREAVTEQPASSADPALSQTEARETSLPTNTSSNRISVGLEPPSNKGTGEVELAMDGSTHSPSSEATVAHTTSSNILTQLIGVPNHPQDEPSLPSYDRRSDFASNDEAHERTEVPDTIYEPISSLPTDEISSSTFSTISSPNNSSGLASSVVSPSSSSISRSHKKGKLQKSSSKGQPSRSRQEIISITRKRQRSSSPHGLSSVRSGRISAYGRQYSPSYKATELAVMAVDLALNISVKDALAGPRAIDSRRAILDEIRSLLDFNVGTYVKPSDIPDRKHVIPTFMFIKHKVHPDGNYDKTKARMVGNGKNQGVHLYDIISSSTVNLASVFMVLNVSSHRRMYLRCYDIKGAFLKAPVDEDELIFILVAADVADIWLSLDPTAGEYITDKGQLYLRLNRYLYGLKQSPFKFQQLLRATLVGVGYTCCTHDECVYVKRASNGAISILCTHVDDILQASDNLQLVDELHAALKAAFNEITYQETLRSYLGMAVSLSPDRQVITLHQEGFARKVLDENLPEEVAARAPLSTPATADLFDLDISSPRLTTQETKSFLSVVMSLMYLARLTRPDLLLAVTFLASRAHCPTQQDRFKLRRVLRYLHGAPALPFVICCTGLYLKCYCDSGYGSHADGKSHSGYILHFSSNKNALSPIFCRSFKQKLTAVSSTEAELLAAIEAVKTSLWLRGLLTELRVIADHSVLLFQDNQSAIMMVDQPTRLKRSKHLLCKLSFLRDQVLQQTVSLQYLNTNDMVADFLTKPLMGEAFLTHRQAIMGSR